MSEKKLQLLMLDIIDTTNKYCRKYAGRNQNVCCVVQINKTK